jgi:cell division septation protein DedD
MALIPMKHNKEYISKSDMGMWETLMQSTPAAPIQTPEQNLTENTAIVAATETEQFKYFIIGGSFRSEENASKYIQQLKEQGYNGQNLGVFKGLNRVAMKGFGTMGEAQKELNSLLSKNPSSGVWIHVNP